MLDLGAPLLSIRHHGAQLEQLEALAVQPEPILNEEGIAGRLDHDGDHQQRKEGEGDEQGQRRRHEVEQPLDHRRIEDRPRRCDRYKQILGCDRVQHASLLTMGSPAALVATSPSSLGTERRDENEIKHHHPVWRDAGGVHCVPGRPGHQSYASGGPTLNSGQAHCR